MRSPCPTARNSDAKAKKRFKLRGDLLDAVEAFKNAHQNDLPTDVTDFEKFRAEFENVNKGLPREQQRYVGNEFLDPSARRMAEVAADNLIIAKADFFDALPDDPATFTRRICKFYAL